MSWVMNSIARFIWRRTSSSSFSTWACTVTSSAETGSSAISTSGFSISARAKPDALALAAGKFMGKPVHGFAG